MLSEHIFVGCSLLCPATTACEKRFTVIRDTCHGTFHTSHRSSNHDLFHMKNNTCTMAGIRVSTHPTIPSDLLGDDPQPSTSTDWDAVVLQAATAYPLYINRETLRFAVAVAAVNQTNGVGQRYVRSYLRRLTAGFSGDQVEFAMWRGLVCELVWTTRSAAPAVPVFRVALGNPTCDDWSVIPVGIQEASDRRDWMTFSPNMCENNNKNAFRIQSRFPYSFRLSCTSETDSPPWCGSCELQCRAIVNLGGFAVMLFVLFIVFRCVCVTYNAYKKWKHVHHIPVHGPR